MSIGQKTTFWKLISSTDIDYIEIPRIQRDYIQGRNTPQVEYARKRIIDEIFISVDTGTPLELNFVYGKEDFRVFIPIDGQQRLTTLFCLHIYAFAKNGCSDEIKILSEKFKYSTRTSTSRFLASLLTCFPEFFEQQSMSMIDYIEDASWYSSEWNKDPSVNSFKIVLSEIHKKFENCENLVNILKSDDCPVTFMSLKIPDIGRINDLYIKMNSRGKPLTEFESFKSELFDFIDENVKSEDGFDKEDFKKKSDNEWLNMIWSICGEHAPAICDTLYIHFLHQIIVNRLLPERYDNDQSEEWQRIKENKGFFNFANYKPYLADKKAIRDIYFTFELYRYILELDNSDISDQFKQLLLGARNLTHKDQVRLASITRYAILVSRENWDYDGFKKWFRVFSNLINNTQIDKPERRIAASNSLMNIKTEMAENTNSYLMKTNGEDIAYFDSRQVAEEVFKCRMIAADSVWEDVIVTAEKHPYFSGEIRFVFLLCGINAAEDVSDHKKAAQVFVDFWRIINLLFSGTGKSNLSVDDNLFRRALLTYGDYSCWANSSYTFFFEDGKGYFNWRRMLRETKSYQIFESFFKALISKNPLSPTQIEEFLISLIDNYSDKNKNTFIYYIVKIPQIMSFMEEKRFRTVDNYNKRNLLYHRARLSADYAEANTFFVFHSIDKEKEYHYGRGYLDSETTSAYIEKIGDTPCHIEFCPDGYFCDKNGTPYLDINSNPITNVEEMLDFIKRSF